MAQRILVLEDDALLLRAMLRMLASAGYEAVGAASGAEALDREAEAPGTFDLVVCDWVLPDISGKVIAALLRERNPGSRFLYVSGHAPPATSSLRPGERFLEKPFGVELFLTSVKEALEHPRTA